MCQVDRDLRQSKSTLHATTAVVAGAASAGFALAEVPRAARTFSDHVHSNANQGGPVRVDHVRQAADVQRVRATALAHLVLVVTLVDAHHRYVDADFLLDLFAFEFVSQ